MVAWPPWHGQGENSREIEGGGQELAVAVA